MWFAWVIWKEFFLKKILQQASQRPTTVHFFHINKWVGEMDEWLRMTNALILCDLIWNVQKRHAANRDGSFNHNLAHKCLTSWVTCYLGQWFLNSYFCIKVLRILFYFDTCIKNCFTHNENIHCLIFLQVVLFWCDLKMSDLRVNVGQIRVKRIDGVK